MVMLRNPDAVRDQQRFLLCKHGRAGITLLFRVIPVGVVALRLKINLTFLELALLNAEYIRIQAPEHILKSLAHTGPESVHIP